MTIKLYEENVYLKNCEAKILDSLKIDNKKVVVLDKTIFFPEAGGQPSDLGKIGDSNVKYVFEKNDIIYHEVDEFPKEKEVFCKLNWNRRFDSMQQHCGEHILSGIIYKKYNGVNKGFHLGEDYVSIDIDIKEITKDMEINIENLSNQAIYENRIIKMQVLRDKESLKNYSLRKDVTVDKNIRIVDIEDTDLVACCGTHPNRTGEVGIIKILKIEKYKGMSRIFFLCGKRALNDYKIKHDMVSNLSKSYSSSIENLNSKIEKEKLKFQEIREEYKNFKIEINNKWVDDYYKSKVSIVEEMSNFEMDDFKYICKKMGEKRFSKNLVLYSNKKLFLIACNCGDENINWGEYFKKTIREFKGSGGGNASIAQGKFKNKEDLENFIKDIKNNLL